LSISILQQLKVLLPEGDIRGTGEEEMQRGAEEDEEWEGREDGEVKTEEESSTEEDSGVSAAEAMSSSSSSASGSSATGEKGGDTDGMGHHQQLHQEHNCSAAVVQQLLSQAAAAAADGCGDWGGQYLGQVEGSWHVLWKEVVEVKNTCPFQVRMMCMKRAAWHIIGQHHEAAMKQPCRI
jgi:hypothetical protein